MIPEHSVQKVWTPHSKNNSPIWLPPAPVLYFFRTAYLWQHFVDNIAQMIYEVNAKINSRGEVISSCFEDYKTTLHSFCYKQRCHLPHQAEIWFEIITVSCIKSILKKNKDCKWKTCWIKSIIATKSIHWQKAVLTPCYKHHLYGLLLPIFTRKSWSPLLWFFKNLNPPIR